MHYNYSIKQIRNKIRSPQLGSNDYGEWGALPLWARFVIDDLCSMVENRDKYIKKLEEKSNDKIE